jgi:ribonucleotide monophosphatase NagD (HAD superfamily)
MGYDTELVYQKLEDACILLGRGVDYIATNPDWVCPTWYGFVPDCGSVAEMLFRATGRRPRFIGKPHPEMLYLAMEKTGYSKEETIMLGDRFYTDIKSGLAAGVDAMLMMSGETTYEDLEQSEEKPTFVMENIRTLHTLLTK